MYANGLSVFVHVYLHLRALEVHGAGLEAAVPELEGQFVEDEDGFLDIGRHFLGLCAFDDGLGALVVEAVVGYDVGAAKPGVDDLGLGREFEHGAEAQLFLVGAQGAQLVGEFLRQHGHGAVYKVYGCSAGLRLLVHGGVRAHVPGYIGNVHAHLEVAVFELPEAEGVVKVLGVGGVDGEGERVPEVPPVGAVFVGDGLGDAVGRILHLFLKAVGKAELGQDGVHLGVVLSGHAQHVHHVAEGACGTALPAVHDGCYLHAFDAAFRNGDGDVVGHGLGAHEHPGLVSHNVQDSHERAARAFYDGDNLAAAAFGFAGLLLRDGHPYDISVEGAARLGGFYVNVFFLSFYVDKDEAVTGHDGFSLILGNDLFLFMVFPVGTVFSSGHITRLTK